jgi:hypothetical protein
MKISKSSLVMTAALTGLMGGTMAQLSAAPSANNTGAKMSAGVMSVDVNAKEKHACKGQNSCKGKGGCKTGDQGCKGKNSCKGKGGCATDGSKKAS